MKKTMILSTALMILCTSFAFSGCGRKNSDIKGKGENESNACTYSCPATGFGFDLPDDMKLAHGFVSMKDLGDLDYDSGVMMGWPTYYDTTEENYNALTEETIDQAHPGYSFDIICVKDVNSETEAKEKLTATVEKMTGGLTEEDRKSILLYKLIHQENGHVWMSKMEDKNDDIREECKEEYNAFRDASDQIISSMKFFTPQPWKGSEEGTALSFKTIDLNGNTVNSETLFAENKVTMINIWATTCGPCIKEMPELEAMNREFKEKGGAIVGLVDDVWEQDTRYLDEAQDIIRDTGVTYTNLCAWKGYGDVLEAVGTPTTYFVNSRGEIIGDAILGAHPKKYKEKMEKYLSQAA